MYKIGMNGLASYAAILSEDGAPFGCVPQPQAQNVGSSSAVRWTTYARIPRTSGPVACCTSRAWRSQKRSGELVDDAYNLIESQTSPSVFTVDCN